MLIGREDADFSPDDRPEWNTEAMETLLKLKLGKRVMLAVVFINPFTAEAGMYEVTIGDCRGEMELREP